MIDAATAAAGEPGFVTALLPKAVESKFGIGKILVGPEKADPLGGVLFKPPRIVQGIHVTHDPVRPEPRGLRDSQARIGGRHKIRLLRQ
jgi:hypothetical protein